MGRRALLIINRNSRNGGTDLEAMRARLADAGIELVEQAPDSKQRIPDLIRNCRRSIDLVILGGGDGTMNLAAEALVETGLPLGVVPLGTANDLARTLSIPVDPIEACEVIAAGRRHRIDLGKVNGKYFFNVAHIGLGAHVARAASHVNKQRWGAFAYAASLLSAYRATRAFRAEIVCDDRRRRIRTIQLAIGNGRHFGGGTVVAAAAHIDDGCFFLCSVEPLDWRNLLAALIRMPHLRAGRFESCDPVHVEQGRIIEIGTRRSMPVSADGEVITRTPARFEIVAEALEVFVPPSYFTAREEIRRAAQG